MDLRVEVVEDPDSIAPLQKCIDQVAADEAGSPGDQNTSFSHTYLRTLTVITSIKIWNEPNNLSHWDFLLDPGWSAFSQLVNYASSAIKQVRPSMPVVLGGMSPVDPGFLRQIERRGALESVDILAVHGFPYDWNLWPIEEWPERLDQLREEFGKPVWVTETGVSSFASEDVASWGLRRSLEVLKGEKVYWYTLLDLGPEREATTRHKQAEGSSYWRHFHFGLLQHDGTPKKSLDAFSPELGICQWFHYRDEKTLDLAVRWFERLGVRHVRTGLSWAESHQDGAMEWFDTIMDALVQFDVCATLCFTPPSRGVRPCHTSPPADPGEFAYFAQVVAERYGAPATIPTPLPLVAEQ
jgi:beta-xylosidase